VTLESGSLPGDVVYAGRIAAVEGLAADAGLQPGDELLAVNDHPIRDVIDVQFYAAEPEVELLIRRGGELWLFELEREYGEPLGLSFEHPTFDTDIRRCNNRCLFCFVTQMAPRGFRCSLAIKDDDYRYSFLEGYYVTLTNLSEADWERIAERHLSPLYVSVHATELGLRRKLLGNPKAPDIMGQLGRLAEAGIEVHAQLVIVPGLNDGDEMARSVRDLATLWPAVKSVSVVPVGLTRFHRHGLRINTQAEAGAVLEVIEGWQETFLERLGDRFVYATDEWYLMAGRPMPPRHHYPQSEALQENGLGLVRQFLDGWEAIRPEMGVPQGSATWPPGKALSLTLVTGTLFAPVLQSAAAELANLTGVPVAVQPVINTTLGETITVAGLLMGRDVVAQLNGAELNDRIVLPEVMFRGPEGVTLDGMTPAEISEAVGRPVALAAGMEDVVALFAHSPVF
jgi:putative radical SAM enzyme (TIGR03279 family)